MKIKFILSLLVLLVPLANSNVTSQNSNQLPKRLKSHTFYVTGNLSTQSQVESNTVLTAITQQMKEDENSTLLLIGNNVSVNDFRQSHDNVRGNIVVYSDILQSVSNQIMFIPGSKDWEFGLEIWSKFSKFHYFSILQKFLPSVLPSLQVKSIKYKIIDTIFAINLKFLLHSTCPLSDQV